MINVCSALMGSGKSSAAINYMNARKEEKFIYISPYLDECERIAKGCRDLYFVQPSDKNPNGGFTKIGHTETLINQGRNIASTHSAFRRYSPSMLESIKRQGYTLIIDESLDLLEEEKISVSDIETLLDAGLIEQRGDSYARTNKKYEYGLFSKMLGILESRDLIQISSGIRGETDTAYYWILPPDLLTSFKDVFVLTYLFEGQDLYYMFRMYHMPYKYIGIKKVGHNNFEFSDTEFYTPEYVANLHKMIHICNDEKLNSIGDARTALSMNWFKTNAGKNGKVVQLRNNIYNYFRHKCGEVKSDQKLWSTFSEDKAKLTAMGFKNSYDVWNLRATNKYRNKKYLVYAVNLFMNVGHKMFFESHGIKSDEDLYALSTLVQWIWRSSIRDGDEIYLYIPSKRMRTLLEEWIVNTERNGNEIKEC